jgi:hypothetical protein
VFSGDDSRSRRHGHSHRDSGRRGSSRYAKVPDLSGGNASGRSQPSEAANPVAPTGVPSQLEQFRAPLRRLRIHPFESLLLVVVAAHLIFLPWALGTMRPLAQWCSLVFSLVSIVIALLPREYGEEHTGGAPFRLIPLPKLLRFPIFWLGLALLGLVVLHALNPAWEYQTDGKNWWVRAIPHAEWLPTGVRAPFERWGPWRMLLIYSSAWLTVCAIWIGFTRRRTVQRCSWCWRPTGCCSRSSVSPSGSSVRRRFSASWTPRTPPSSRASSTRTTRAPI